LTSPEATQVPLRGLPDALDAAVYVHNRWPLVVDPTGQAARFLQYQHGAFVVASVPAAVKPETLRERLVSCLQHGRALILSFGTHDADVQALFKDGWFPSVGTLRSYWHTCAGELAFVKCEPAILAGVEIAAAAALFRRLQRGVHGRTCV
jgi:hypothetical protein